MLKSIKSIATAHSDCTAKHKNKASYNTDYIDPDLTNFLAMIEKLSKHRLKKQIFTLAKGSVLTKNWFIVSNF